MFSLAAIIKKNFRNIVDYKSYSSVIEVLSMHEFSLKGVGAYPFIPP